MAIDTPLTPDPSSVLPTEALPGAETIRCPMCGNEIASPEADAIAAPSAAVGNANSVHNQGLSRIDRLAIALTDKVGSFGFFLMIFTWTVTWCGYNILAKEVPGLHWPQFDPFPAFVAYLLISNVIQILLMPLIMVGQNIQGRHSETRAELDFQVNQKAQKEVEVILRHLEHNTELTMHLMRHLQCQLTEEESNKLSSDVARIRSLKAAL